jgi:hypothetical protein
MENFLNVPENAMLLLVSIPLILIAVVGTAMDKDLRDKN